MLKRTTCLLLTIFLIMAVCGCARSDSSPSSSTGQKDSVIIAMTGGEPGGFDPQRSLDLNAMTVFVNIYDTLVESDGACSNDIRPELATSWEISNDGLTYTFHLRDDVTFHNGEPFTSADAKYSIERARAEPASASYCTMIESVEAPDPYTVVIHLNMKFADFMRNIGGVFFAIVNEKAITEADADYARNPVGTGPYKFVEWRQGDYITLEANEEYFNAGFPIKHVTYKYFADTSTAMIALQNGEIDAFPNSAAIDAPTVAADPNLSLTYVASDTSTWVGMNLNAAPFDDIKVREAIRYAINKEAVLKGALNGEGILANSNLNEKMLGYNPNDPLTNLYDLEKARELMREAGYENGFSCTMKVVPTDSRDKAAQIVQAQLKEIGINIQIEQLERATFFEVAATGDYEMVLHTINWPDADNMLTYLYHSEGPFNWKNAYNNPQVDDLLLQARQELDSAKRSQLYAQIVQITFDNCHNIPLYFPNQYFSAKKDLLGIEIIDNVYFPPDRWHWAE